jgi:hypothetical protein
LNPDLKNVVSKKYRRSLTKVPLDTQEKAYLLLRSAVETRANLQVPSLEYFQDFLVNEYRQQTTEMLKTNDKFLLQNKHKINYSERIILRNNIPFNRLDKTVSVRAGGRSWGNGEYVGFFSRAWHKSAICDGFEASLWLTLTFPQLCVISVFVKTGTSDSEYLQDQVVLIS